MWSERLRRFWPVPALILTAALAFSLGRFLTPARVETRTQEKIVYQDRIVEKRVEVRVADTAARQVVERVRYVYPDGTRVERETERAQSSSHTEAASLQVRTEEKIVYRDRVETKLVEARRPRLRLGLGPETYLGDLMRPRLIGPFDLAGAIDVRIAGPAWVQLSGSSAGRIGLMVGLEF